ncbi:ankyrin repeat domain-containing protein [Wolbachia endosymbiont (group B) of Camptogramma bilineatum]|uniref:ankyrin repeat domain-containing protein n=1 Tax=Wolbachia endosymbiont (group B) of Camptogramma bilineatum TaxID=2953991 RepID=UPI00223037C0|nr:ankyrin repeat domain-containing protein [Wolbachia endosymbiont (group B) of Camptogramma bilineatum]
MAIEKEKFFKIINEVSKSGGLDEDNLLERIKNELKGKDAGEYNKFSKNFSKEHQFSIKFSEEAAEDWTLLHLAAACNNLLIAEFLMKKKASVSARVKDGSKNDGLTALHIAASCGHESMVKQLLSDDRVNPSLKSKNKTPREVVGNIENKEAIVKMLKEAEQNFCTKHEKKTAAPADVINSVKQYDTIRSGAQAPVTCESSDSLVSEQDLRVSVKNMVEKFESPQRKSATCSGKQTPIDESVSSDDSGLELETTFNTSSCSEINHDEAVDNQTLESLPSQIQLRDSQIQKLQEADEELKRVKNCMGGHENRLEVLDKLSEENQSLKQQIQDLKSKNTTLNSELSKTKANKVLLEKTEKGQLCFLKVASVNLVTMLTVGVIFSVAFQLPILSMIAISVMSSLIVGGVTYALSPQPTELKK